MSVCTDSGGQTRQGGDIGQLVFPEIVLDAAAQDQQASVLAGVERVGHARARPPAEAVRLVVVTGAVSIERSEGARETPLLWEVHVRWDTPYCCLAGTPSRF